MKLKSLLICFFIGCGLALSAQSITVKSFRALPTDMTATSDLEGKRIDQNGEVAALIKVVTPETGFVFEGGTLGIVDTKQKVGEIWVWVPKSSRKITILHHQLGVLRDYRYPVEIEAGHTYEMELIKVSPGRVIDEDLGQFLAFQISPTNAVLEVNGQLWEIDPDGKAKKYVSLGTYTYRVQAPNYHSEEGTVKTNGSNQIQTVTIALKPNYGWIEVSGENNCFGASIYINNSYAGKTPFKSKAIGCGQYKLCVVKDMFDMYCETITVSENKTSKVTPTLIASMLNYSDASDDNDMAALMNDSKFGIINGVFSVSPTNKVYFSKGNLQYQASTNSWRFAERQWDYVGETNQNISDSYNGWIDLFGWGTGSTPTKHSSYASDYSNYVEWGNNISIESRSASRWRTMTKDEWDYLLNVRKTESGIRYAKAKVNYINGVIILPDNWKENSYKLNNTNDDKAAYSSNLITASEWDTMESLGAVFLPSAGYRCWRTTISNSGQTGYYMSESRSSYVSFSESSLYLSTFTSPENGKSIRLVLDFK